MMKRAFDVIASGSALVCLSPLLIVLATALRIRHGAPVLFRQTRVGRRGEPFEVHKFRTMTTEHAFGPAVTSSNDPRVHAMGRFLRSSKLDELPQLWDVLRGRMSVVGPRPEVPEFVEHWPAKDRDLILSVRPGITDPASVRFRHESELLAKHEDPRAAYITEVLPIKCGMYVEYVSDPSLGRDLKVILKTFQALVCGPTHD